MSAESTGRIDAEPALARRVGMATGPGDGDEQVDTPDWPQPPCFWLAGLLGDLRPHPELDLDTLAYHLRQSDATAADGYCHAAINEARSFLEALVVSIVHSAQRQAAVGEADSALRDRSQNGTAFRTYRRYLLQARLIDADENDLLQYVYSVASAKGSHHGVTDEAWARLARRMVFSAAQYLLQRYAAWKHNGHCRPSAESGSPDASRNGRRRAWLTPVLRWLAPGAAARDIASAPCKPRFPDSGASDGQRMAK